MYNHKNDTSLWRGCMHIKIKFDVCKPLKRKEKKTCRNGKEFVVQCKCESLGEFCFVCGMVSHTERFCRRFLGSRGDENNREGAAGYVLRRIDWANKEGASGWETTGTETGKLELETITEPQNSRKLVRVFQERNKRTDISLAKNKSIISKIGLAPNTKQLSLIGINWKWAW